MKKTKTILIALIIMAMTSLAHAETKYFTTKQTIGSSSFRMMYNVKIALATEDDPTIIQMLNENLIFHVSPITQVFIEKISALEEIVLVRPIGKDFSFWVFAWTLRVQK